MFINVFTKYRHLQATVSVCNKRKCERFIPRKSQFNDEEKVQVSEKAKQGRVISISYALHFDKYYEMFRKAYPEQ